MEIRDDLKAKLNAAAVDAINQTMADAVSQAKSNHPGWHNVTGQAEASVKVLTLAKVTSKGVSGTWGSEVFYVPWLEIKNGSFLRSAGDAIYPRLNDRLKAALDQ